jgi:hypothetical protein
VIFEEFQEALRTRQVGQFSRLLALARFKKVSLWFANQQPSQISRVDPTLVRLLRTNTGLEAWFRSSLEDAKTVAHALPVAAADQTPSEVRRAVLEEMTRLPRREFRLWIKEAEFRAQRVRSPKLDLDAVKRRAELVPEEFRAAIRRGTVARSRDELSMLASRDEDPLFGDPDTVDELLAPVEGPHDDAFPGIG